ncbi:hypothetical protein PM082_011932 [Marasmius tenuissimus]|nr:hypothetical protein PM082_011932 [Marasmius tenuissimus]
MGGFECIRKETGLMPKPGRCSTENNEGNDVDYLILGWPGNTGILLTKAAAKGYRRHRNTLGMSTPSTLPPHRHRSASHSPFCLSHHILVLIRYAVLPWHVLRRFDACWNALTGGTRRGDNCPAQAVIVDATRTIPHIDYNSALDDCQDTSFRYTASLHTYATNARSRSLLSS